MIKIIPILYLFLFISCQDSSKNNRVEDIFGCMDQNASNFDINATVSNDSCIFKGCTDSEAVNYNPFATIDDGNCLSEDLIPEGHTYYWNDEFNGDTLNRKYWNIENWWTGAFNNELQSYTSELSNITLQNGYLYIRAQKENPFNPNQPKYTSGRLNTKDKVELKYGYWEVRAKLPSGIGTWPAIWMLNSIIDSIPWPYSGEIDIMEHVGYDPDRVYFSMHNENLYGNVHGTDQQGVYYLENIEDDFHIYSIEWDESEVRGYVDGIEIFEKSRENNYSDWPYDSPFFLIINLAIGGDWGGVQGVDNSIFPSSFIIDFARLYKKDN